MRRHADLAEPLEDVLGDAIIEHALAFDQRMLLRVERSCVILEVLDERAGLRALVKHLGLAFVDPTPLVHGSWSFDDHAHALFRRYPLRVPWCGTIDLTAVFCLERSWPRPADGDIFQVRTLAEAGVRNNLNERRTGGLGSRPNQAVDLSTGPGYGVTRNRVSGVRHATHDVAVQQNKNTAVAGRAGMTTFDNREKAFENKFARDADLKFRAESRRNKVLAEWAAEKLGITGDAVADYVKAVRKADLAREGRRRRRPQGAEGLRRQGRHGLRRGDQREDDRVPGQGRERHPSCRLTRGGPSAQDYRAMPDRLVLRFSASRARVRAGSCRSATGHRARARGRRRC